VLQFEAWFEVEEQKQKKEKGKRKKTFDLRRLRHGLRTRPPIESFIAITAAVEVKSFVLCGLCSHEPHALGYHHRSP
jgi:hypothetical protein